MMQLPHQAVCHLPSSMMLFMGRATGQTALKKLNSLKSYPILQFGSSCRTGDDRRHAWRAWCGPIEETFLNALLWRRGAGYHRGSPAAYSCEQDLPGSGRHDPRGVHRVGRVYLLRSSLRCTLSGMSRRQKWRFSACGGRVYRRTSTCVQW